MLLDFEPLRRWLPAAEQELHALLEKEIAALGDTPPQLDFSNWRVSAPQDWEVRFERSAAGAPARLAIEEHPKVHHVGELLAGPRSLPPALRETMTVVCRDADVRASLELLRSAGA